MPTGKIKSVNVERQFGFITADSGKDIHFRLQEVDQGMGRENIQVGMKVSFEVAQGEKGPTAVNVRPVGSPQPPNQSARPTQQTTEPSPTRPGERFLNPYNFVRPLSEPLHSVNLSPEARRMGKCSPPPHNRLEGQSGKITCTMTALTPLFVSSNQPSEMEGNHPRYRFYQENGKKTIPASTLRGMVRTIFEAVTNSCFTSISDQPLSYRLEPGKAGYLVPARIEEKNNTWGLRLLTGTASLSTAQKPGTLYPASIRLYNALKPSGRGIQAKPQPLVDLTPLGKVGHPSEQHGKECWAVLLKMKFPPSWRVVAVAQDRASAQAALTQMRARLPGQAQTLVQPGYLCITNQNIDNKANERFFFDDVSSGSKVIPLPDAARRKYSELIADYQDRHQTEVKERQDNRLDPRLPTPNRKDEPGFSRFILQSAERYPQHGDLVYAMLRGYWPNVQLEYIAPVSIPRVAYEHSPADLLPEHLRHCESYDALCPACRTFGWVKPANTERSEQGGYRGRLRFTNATIKTSVPLPPIRLAELGSPKPTTTRFYLTAPDGKPGKGRSDAECGYDGNQGKNTLRGRKIYRNFAPDPQYMVAKEANNRNRTILDPEGAGAQFEFEIRFENLYPEELGALLWALTLGGEGAQKVGMGKPLGLGSVDVHLDALDIENYERRYTTLDVLASAESGDPTQFVYKFMSALVSFHMPEAASRSDANVEELFHTLAPVKDLLALLGKSQPALPVHYPYSPVRDSKGSFEWFVGNKRVNGPRIEMDLAERDNGLPFIDKFGQVK